VIALPVVNTLYLDSYEYALAGQRRSGWRICWGRNTRRFRLRASVHSEHPDAASKARDPAPATRHLRTVRLPRSCASWQGGGKGHDTPQSANCPPRRPCCV